MPAANKIRIHIEADGTVSFDSDDFEEAIHDSADKFMLETFEALGGEHKIVEHKREDQHSHVHGDGHVHTH